MNKIKTFCLAMMMMTSILAMAQMRLNFGDDSQLRKLQIAEMAIKSLYVDSVDEKKTRGRRNTRNARKTRPSLLLFHTERSESHERTTGW